MKQPIKAEVDDARARGWDPANAETGSVFRQMELEEVDGPGGWAWRANHHLWGALLSIRWARAWNGALADCPRHPHARWRVHASLNQAAASRRGLAVNLGLLRRPS